MSVNENTQLLLAKGILGFWVLVFIACTVFLGLFVVLNWSDIWYTFGFSIMAMLFLLILYVLLRVTLWAFSKVTEKGRR